MEKYAKYRGVILLKTKYGIFVDLGLHFNWKFGSLLGLVHKSILTNKSDYDSWNAGDEIITLFLEFNEKNQLVLSDNRELGKWLNGKMEELIGTVQKVSVVINENGKTEYYVLGKHKAIIPIKKDFYPNLKTEAKKYTYELKNGEVINCEVITMNKRKDCFILKLLIQP